MRKFVHITGAMAKASPVFFTAKIVAVVLFFGWLGWGIHYIAIGCPDNNSELIQNCTPNGAGGYTCVPEWRRVSGC